MGTITQVRVLGGVIAVAICQALLSSRLLNELGPVLGQDKLSSLLQSVDVINTFTSEEAGLVRDCYGRAFGLQNKLMIAFSALSALSCLGAWKRHWEEAASVEKRHIHQGFEMMSKNEGYESQN